MAVGDIKSAWYRAKVLTEDGTAAIVKGDLCIIRAGKVMKIVAATNPGPYVIAEEAIAKSGSGLCIFEGIVTITEGNDAAATLGDVLVPSATTVGHLRPSTVTDFSSNYVQAEVQEIYLQVGIAWEAISKDGTGDMLLGWFPGRNI